MKTTTYPLILCVLAGWIMLSCAQKEEPEVVPPQEPDTPAEYCYTFGLASEGNESVKSTFASNYVNWDNGDHVGSYAKTSKNKSTDVVVNGSDVTITIRSSVALSTGDKVYAYAPYRSGNDSKESTAIKLEIPANQSNGSADAMPMVSIPFELTEDVPSYTNTEVGKLQFMNLVSVIKLNIYSADFHGETIQKVTFQPGVACAGEFEYDLTGVSLTPAAISGYKETEVVVTGNETVGADAEHGGVFYIVVAPGTYGGNFIISTNRTDYTYTSSGTRTYERAHIKPLKINLSSTNWTASTVISTPQDLINFLNNTSSSDTKDYVITADLDMTGKTITSASGFNGTLDGRLHTISNLTSSVPLFAANNGTISNLIIDETCAFSAGTNVFGALVAQDNGGAYESIRNRATITYTATANVETDLMIGSLIGKANGATLTSCTNAGAVTIEATGHNHNAVGLGGIVGYAEATTFDACVNRGPVSLNADFGNPKTTLSGWSNGGVNIGGVLGAGQDYSKNNYCTFKDCNNEAAGIITLNHTRIDGLTAENNKNSASNRGVICVGGILGRARGHMKNCKNFAAINVTAITSNRTKSYRQNYVPYVGGIAGLGLWALSFESCRNDGKITVIHDGTWDAFPRERAGVGGICGREDQDYGDRTSGCADVFANYCNVYGDIEVRGNCDIAVGGIFGINGKQIGNQVKSDCNITVETRWAYIGGVVGVFQANPNDFTIKRSSCAATITASRWDNESTYNTYFAVGGLIGRWEEKSTDGNYSILTQRDNVPCAFTGSISTTTEYVGIVVGYVGVSGKTITFGDASPKIKASGTFEKKDVASTVITASNVEGYAVGGNDGSTLITNVEYVAP